MSPISPTTPTIDEDRGEDGTNAAVRRENQRKQRELEMIDSPKTLSADEFLKYWREDFCDLSTLEESEIKKTPFDDDTKSFLSKVGVPDEMAPGVVLFPENETNLATLAETLSLSDKFQRYRIVGSVDCWSSNHLCCDDTLDGKLFHFNADDLYPDDECETPQESNLRPTFVNSSIIQLYHSCLCYELLISETIEKNGDSAFVDKEFPEGYLKWIATRIETIDPDAYGEGTYWHQTIQELSK